MLLQVMQSVLLNWPRTYLPFEVSVTLHVELVLLLELAFSAGMVISALCILQRTSG